jgi:hypothetical protein
MQSYSLQSPDSLLLYMKLNPSTIIIIHFSAGHKLCGILWIIRLPFLGAISIINLIKSLATVYLRLYTTSLLPKTTLALLFTFTIQKKT